MAFQNDFERASIGADLGPAVLTDEQKRSAALMCAVVLPRPEQSGDLRQVLSMLGLLEATP